MNRKISPQRKTTLKWNSNGELSEIDMLRIIENIPVLNSKNAAYMRCKKIKNKCPKYLNY